MKPMSIMILVIIMSTMMVVTGGHKITNSNDDFYYNDKDDYDKVIGNTQANIFYGGIAMESNGWIYYSNSSDYFRLYKMKSDGTNKIKLSEKAVSNINVVGDWIYCSATDVDIYNDSIYKIKIDGSESVLLSEQSPGVLYVTQNHIYFNRGNYGTLGRMSHNGEYEERILEDYKFSTEFKLYKDWIYYLKYDSNSRSDYLMKVKLDGSEVINLKQKIKDFIIIDDWVYYSSSSDDWRIYKMRIDGTDVMKLSDDSASKINIYDEWIYYNSWYDDSKLYKMKLDGTQKTLINEVSGSKLNIAGDWIFYTEYGIDPDGYWCYRIKTDGTEKQIVD